MTMSWYQISLPLFAHDVIGVSDVTIPVPFLKNYGTLYCLIWIEFDHPRRRRLSFFDDVAEGGERTETKFNAGMIFLSFFLLLIILCGGKIGLLMSRTRTSLFHPQVMHIYVSKKRIGVEWFEFYIGRFFWSSLSSISSSSMPMGNNNSEKKEEDQCDEKYQFLLRRLSKKRKRHRLAFYSTLQQAWHPVFLRLGVSRQTDWLTDCFVDDEYNLWLFVMLQK